MSHGNEANWTPEDRFHLTNLTVPVPTNEQKRVEILRKSKLLDVATNDTGFSRFTSLASRLFGVSDSFTEHFRFVLISLIDCVISSEFILFCSVNIDGICRSVLRRSR